MSLFDKLFKSDADDYWTCDKCNAMLDNQRGFTTATGGWKCLKCGFLNDVSDDNTGYDSQESSLEYEKQKVLMEMDLEDLKHQGLIDSIFVAYSECLQEKYRLSFVVDETEKKFKELEYELKLNKEMNKQIFRRLDYIYSMLDEIKI